MPFGENFSFVPLSVPTAFAWLPFELSVPSKFASPPRPLAGSINPEAPISMFSTFTVASKGVLAASSALIGPAFPEIFASPPPGNWVVSLNGNCEVKEKFFTSIVTLS